MITITRAHKIRLQPTCKQDTYFKKACGVARFTYNWALDAWKKAYSEGEKPNGLQLKKQFNAIKKESFPWIYDVTKYASQQPFFFLQNAFNRFFSKKSSYPNFKKKGKHDSFYIGNDQFKIEGKRIWIPKLGWVKMRESLRYSGKLLSATVSRTADQWYVSISVEIALPAAPSKNQACVGIDLGINRLATLFDGQSFEIKSGPKPLRKKLKQLKRAQRRLSRKVKGSQNRSKQRLLVAKIHADIRNRRQDSLHQLTTRITEDYGVIKIEDLNVKGMMANSKLARSIADMGFYEFRRQLEYKAQGSGSTIVIADRWFPSSKQCSSCQSKNEKLTLRERIFCCSDCGLKIDRDQNAAKNLYEYSSTVSSTGFKACGEEGAGSSISLSETGLVEAGTKPCTDLYTF